MNIRVLLFALLAAVGLNEPRGDAAFPGQTPRSTPRDAALCDPLPPAKTFPHVNEIHDSLERCRETVAIYRRPDFKSDLHSGPSAFSHAADFETALQQIGYPSDYGSSLVPKPMPDAHWQFVSRLRFRGPESDRNEFVRRVMAPP